MRRLVAFLLSLLFAIGNLRAQSLGLNRMPLTELRVMAEHGDAGALLQLGMRCYMGQGVPHSVANALEFWQKAAWAGRITAQGICAAHGYGREKDCQVAFECFQKGAREGDSAALWNLGRCYEVGWGTVVDRARAFELYRESAESQDSCASFFLGWAYLGGSGTKKDPAKAVEIWEKASLTSSVQMEQLGSCYFSGLGVPKDLGKANEIFQKAGDMGEAIGYLNLGNSYERGLGVEKNMAKARELYAKAAAMGVAEAQQRLKELGPAK